MAPNLITKISKPSSDGMTPRPGFDVYKSYFNNPKFSSHTIRFGDKTIYVHDVILCRRSEYFEKLIDGPFKESGQKEIELHEDDLVVMEALFRYIYDYSYNELYENTDSKLQLLAELYVTGHKYQVKGIEVNVVEYMDPILWYDTTCSFHSLPHLGTKDFLAALETIMAGTPSQDVVGRRLMVKFCAAHIYELRQMPDFVNLLKEFGELGASILQVENLDLMLDGCWYCCSIEDRRSVPRCRQCDEIFPLSYVRQHRTEKTWECVVCEQKTQPVCTQHNGTHWIEWHWHLGEYDLA